MNAVFDPRVASCTASATDENGTSRIASILSMSHPAARNRTADVRLVLVIRLNEFDLDVRLLSLEVLDREFRGCNRT